MENFNYELEEKLDQHFDLKFDKKSDGNSLETLKSYFDSLIDHNWPLIAQKMKMFTFEREEMLDQHFDQIFDGKSNDDNNPYSITVIRYECSCSW